MSAVCRKHGYCTACRSRITQDTRSGYCAACEVLTKVSIRKDGARGYLWVIYANRDDAIEKAVNDDAQSFPHAWTSTEAEAITSAQEAAGGVVARDIGFLSRSIARKYLQQRRADRRARSAQRFRAEHPSQTVEYLFSYSGKRFQITKRTAKRVYFRWNESAYVEAEDQLACVSHVKLASKGGVWVAKLCESVMTEESYKQIRGEVNARGSSAENFPSIQECRRQMQRHHPDKGGDAEQFQHWRKRFNNAKAAYAANRSQS